MSGCSHIHWGFVPHPSSDSPRAPCLSVMAERLTSLKTGEVGSYGGPFLTGHSGSVNLLHILFASKAWVCGKV